jgi:hypothetical protein
MTNVAHEKLLRALDYNPVTGVFVWKVRPREDFASENAWKAINKRQAGKVAGYLCPKSGYIHIGLDGKLYRAHRLAWFYVTGEWPSDQIDHEFHDRADNRICKLRESCDADNRKNQSISKRNKSGVMGVHWYAARSKWQAYINDSGRRRNLGYFTDKDDAIAARKNAERLYGFHENHGMAA